MKKYIGILGLILMFLSCSEEWMSDVVPTNRQKASEAFNTVKDGRNAVNGVFSMMQHQNYYGANYVVYGDLKGVDVRITSVNKRKDNMYMYKQTTEASYAGMFTRPYRCLVSINNAIDNVANIVPGTEEDKVYKKEIEANLYALRGLVHFDLLKVFARIPTALDGDISSELGVVISDRVITKDEQPMRSNLEESYGFVIKDLNKALELMPATAKTKGWFTSYAVKALLARVHLYMGNNKEAYDYAKEVIDDGGYGLMTYGEYGSSWSNSSNNPEEILVLINTDDDNPSREGIGYLWSHEGYNTMFLTESFLGELSVGDDRLAATKEKDGNFVCNKYPEPFSYLIRLIRLSEMYFIAAEAAYKQNNATIAAELINKVLENRLNTANVLMDTDITLDRILLEKRKEFVGEGHCVFDLIRNRKNIVRAGADHLVGAPMEVLYDDFRIIEPIPRIELNSNSSIQQNPVYAK